MTSNRVHLLVKDAGGDVIARSMQLIAGRTAEKLQGQVILGERVKSRLRGAGSRREQPSVRRFESRDLKSVLKVVADYYRLPEEKLVGRRTGYQDERAIAMELMYRYGGASQPEIGKVMGDLDYTAVSRERTRLRERANTERGLRAALDEIGTSLTSKVKI